MASTPRLRSAAPAATGSEYTMGPPTRNVPTKARARGVGLTELREGTPASGEGVRAQGGDDRCWRASVTERWENGRNESSAQELHRALQVATTLEQPL